MVGRIANGLAVLVPGGSSARVTTLKTSGVAVSLDVVVVARLCVVAGLIRARAVTVTLC